MKKIILFILILSGASSIAQAGLNIPEAVAWIDFAAGASSDITISLTSDKNQGYYTELVNFEGVRCRKIPQDKMLYFQVKRSAVPSSANNLLISITYFDNNWNDMSFQYNAVGTGDDAAFKSANFAKNNTGEWVTTTLSLTDAELNGKMFGSDDMRIGGTNYIKEVKISIGALHPEDEPVPPQQNLPLNQFRGKSFAGYQIWHKAGDTPEEWNHWSYGNIPAPGFQMYGGINVPSFPDLSEYPDSLLYPTHLGPLGNGRATGLYHAMNPAVIRKQMKWLEETGFEGVGVGRFVGNIGHSITLSENSHLTAVKEACEATGRLFFIGYDLNGSDANIVERMKKDWVYEIEQIRGLTSSPNYTTVDGKPVVLVWGVGMTMASAEQTEAIIDFLHSRGCYIIGGVSRGWRLDPPPGFESIFLKLDCISPWTVGVYNNISGADNYKNTYMTGDKAYCDQYSRDYLPVVFPSSANWLGENLQLSQSFRQGGEFFWKQMLNAQSVGVSSVYYAMLDEFEESTNYIKGAVDYFDIPVDQYFETFSRDGIWVSHDYYLRLAAYASRMLRGDAPLTVQIPVPYSEGPLYYRNSFESRYATFNIGGSGKGPGENPDYETVLPVDPCFYRPQLLSRLNVNNPVCRIDETTMAKTGNYAVRFSGTPNSEQNANYSYLFAEVKIGVKQDMKFSFWKYSENELGKYTSVDLRFQSGKILSRLAGYTDNNGTGISPAEPRGSLGTWEQFSCVIGQGELTGDTITGIGIAYDHPQAGASYSAYFDDIIVSDGNYATGTDRPLGIKSNGNIYALNRTIVIESLQSSTVSVYTVSGQLTDRRKITAPSVSIPVKERGIYIVIVNGNGPVEHKKVIVL